MCKSIISYLWAFLIGVGMMMAFFKPAIGILILIACGLIYTTIDFNSEDDIEI